jgi:hypothetical protein
MRITLNMTHFSMGAINKNTNNFEPPIFANKSNKYKCPSCEKDVIFKKGNINRAHFAHYKSDDSCYYYNNPGESQIHKDAKMLMKTLLDNKTNIVIYKTCNYCEQRNCPFPYGFEIEIWDEEYNENTRAVIEHKFYYNDADRRADVALIENDKIKYIFEICYRNKTKNENRPEPWVEIDAEDLIYKINSGENIDEDGNISIKCIRNYKCEECIVYDEKIKQEQIEKKIKEKQEQIEKKIKERREQEQKWRESLKQKEADRIRKLEYKIIREEEERLSKLCDCGIMIKNICICETPKYELTFNNLFCVNCNRWKCRCT